MVLFLSLFLPTPVDARGRSWTMGMDLRGCLCLIDVTGDRAKGCAFPSRELLRHTRRHTS